MFLNKASHRILTTKRGFLLKKKVVSTQLHSRTAFVVFKNAQSRNYSYNASRNNSRSLFSSNEIFKTCKTLPKDFIQMKFYALPPFNKIVLPALSPTMETGTIVQWQVKEGDRFEPGDLLADIETDKATMGFEAIEEGYIAKILVKEGSKDVPLGTLVAISVDNEEDLAAFKNVSADELSGDQTSAGTASASAAPAKESPPAASSANLPSHDRVVLPALSPTMTTGTIVEWEKQEGDKIDEGDSIALIETDKASMALEYQDEGYLAKILMKEGVRDLPLGTPLCIVVSNKEDIAAFANYVDSGASASAPSAAEPAPGAQSSSKPESTVSPPVPTSQPATPTPTGDRLFVSPFAKKLAAEKGLNLSQFAGLGSGPGGRIRAQDLNKTPVEVATPSVAKPASTTVPPPSSDGEFIDIPLSNIRKVTAKRLLESKETIPHYYLTIDVMMDNALEVRKNFNQELKADGVKLSVNDFIVKAAALACLKVPEANSSWRDTFIRQYNTVDMSIAVSTDNGLITPIVFDAHSKGLVSISEDTASLAAKARDGKLKPQEFQGGTFTISNLGMFGVKHFSAIINPPQACILAVGSARKEFAYDENAENESKAATIMSVTLSCDHRVVDGAVGAKWLQQFKRNLEDPITMLL